MTVLCAPLKILTEDDTIIVRDIRQTLLNTAEAFREAGKKAEAARQEFLRFCYDRHPVGFDYDDITNLTGLLTPAAVSAMARYNRFDCIDIRIDGSAVFQYFTVSPDGVTCYNWEEIERILHNDNATQQEVIALGGILQMMTIVEPDGTVSVDLENMTGFIRRGYKNTFQNWHWLEATTNPITLAAEAALEVLNNIDARSFHYELTPTMTDLLALYKVYVDISVAENADVFRMSNPQGEDRIRVRYLEAELLKAAMIDGILNQGPIRQSTFIERFDRGNKASMIEAMKHPQFSITAEGRKYVLDLGVKKIDVFSAETRLSKDLTDVRATILPSLRLDNQARWDEKMVFGILTGLVVYNKIPGGRIAVGAVEAIVGMGEADKQIAAHNLKVTNIENVEMLNLLVDAFALKGSMSVVDNEVRMINILNETELQIRVHSYNYTCREGGVGRPANPNHKDITLAELIDQIGSDDTVLRNDYMAWWDDENDWRVYREVLNTHYHDYMINHQEFKGTNLEQLRPSQINELHKKVMRPDHVLDLGGKS